MSNVVITPGRIAPVLVSMKMPRVDVGVGSSGPVDIQIGEEGPQGPPGTINVVYLTEAEFADLDPKVPNYIYVIT